MTDGRLPVAESAPERPGATAVTSPDGEHGLVGARGPAAAAVPHGAAARRLPMGIAGSVTVIGFWARLVVLRHGGGVTLQA